MQIYLQTKVIKKILLRVGSLLTCVGIMLYAGKSKNAQTPVNSYYDARQSKYLATSTSNYENKSVLYENKADQINLKMNNNYSQNASIGVNSNKNTDTENNNDSFPFANVIELPDTQSDILVYDHNQKSNIRLPLEEYVTGCVCAEMPSNFDLQALMAQAVAVRTFTVRKMLYDDGKTHNGADICTDYRHCQSYISKQDYLKRGEYATDQYEKIKQAVFGTKGVVALYNGQPINAVYHASSGIKTKSSKEVWGGEIPYLVSVKAPEDKSLCAKKYEFTYEQISNKLSKQSDTAVECFNAQQVIVSGTDSSKNITISGKVFDSKQVKNALGLRSDYYDVTAGPKGVVFETYGYGHLVGMSQYGADALAKQGKSYIDILKYYYKDIELGYLN